MNSGSGIPGSVGVVVMGVSGSGKSTVGPLIAAGLSGTFLDADDLHAPEAVAKMASGAPLDDEDRWPWLERVAHSFSRAGPVVVACSALRRAHRDRLRMRAERELVFIHLHGDPAVLAGRLQRRAAHFMPATLLTSQLATLEPLTSREIGRVFAVVGDASAIANEAIEWLRSQRRSGG